MSNAYVILEIKTDISLNDYTRFLRELEENENVENIEFQVD